jgi:hypothetical protein
MTHSRQAESNRLYSAQFQLWQYNLNKSIIYSNKDADVFVHTFSPLEASLLD